MNIADVAWVDIRDKLRTTDLLIVPLGGTETYGHHLATALVQTLAAALVAWRPLPKRWITVTVPVGPSRIPWAQAERV